jgi:hypothetical protein
MCDLCQGLGYRMQDIGTATIPDFIEVPCACNPYPTDFDYPDFDVVVIDFDPPTYDYTLPAHLLALTS